MLQWYLKPNITENQKPVPEIKKINVTHSIIDFFSFHSRIAKPEKRLEKNCKNDSWKARQPSRFPTLNKPTQHLEILIDLRAEVAEPLTVITYAGLEAC